MEVTMQKNGDVSARLTVNVVESDYADKVTKDLKEVGRNHVIPGFRKGHVPFGELKRRFGMQVTSDVINREVYDAVANYLRDNKVDILGEPLPVEVVELDLKNKKDFTFEYDLALTPALDVNVGKDITVPYYTIAVADDMIDEQDKGLRKRFGAQVPGEEMEPDALVKGALMQLNEDGTVNENEGAIQVVSGIVAPMYFKSKDEAAKFDGKKVGDKVVFNPWNTCDGDPTEMSSMLQIDKEIASDVKSDFEMAISEIIVVRPAELNEEFFTNVFGKDKVHNEEEYRNAVKEMIASQLGGNSEILFRQEAQKALMDKYGEMTFADELLKRWLINRNEGLNEENIDEEYVKLLPGLKWQLISDRVARQADVMIEEDDLLNFAKMMAARQFAQYGMTNLDEEIITNYAKQMLNDKNYRGRIIEQVGDAKLFTAIKELVTVDNKEVSLDEFKEIAQKA